jgi:hypothetical protein
MIRCAVTKTVDNDDAPVDKMELARTLLVAEENLLCMTLLGVPGDDARRQILLDVISKLQRSFVGDS